MNRNPNAERVAALEAAIKETLDRWAEITGDGSMWGQDAYILGPIAEAIDMLSEVEKKSARKTP